MKIAIVAPLMERVPPRLYGGTERIVSYLTEELIQSGHDVTLFAAGDSVTRASLRAVVPQSLRLDPECGNPLAYHLIMLDEVIQAAQEFDVIHFHIDLLQFPSVRRLAAPSVTTLHGRLDLAEHGPLFRRFRDVPLVSISDAQRAPIPWANWIETIPHGLPANLHPFQPRPGGYLAFLGRISPEKRPDRAIAIARQAGVPLRIAAKVDNVDRVYFEERVRPLLAQPGVEFIGEIDESAKSAFLGDALALLFPIDWPEPFGLAMIEAMACGTPVIAYRRGSVPEIVADGVTGFVVDDEAAAVDAVGKLDSLDRRRCREMFELRFDVRRMASEYLAAYRRVGERRAAREVAA